MKRWKAMRAGLLALLAAALMVLAACGSSGAAGSDASGQASGNSGSGNSSGNAASQANDVQEENGKYTPALTVTSVKAISDDLQKLINIKPDVLTDNIWFNSYADDLGIQVKYNWTVPASQMEEKMNVAISSNDLPDIIPANARQFKMLVDTGVATDLTSLFEQYATPFTKQMWEEDNQIGRTQATVGGKLMALPSIGGAVDNAPILWIRYDWLEKLHLQPPKSMQDVLNIAELFTKNDPDGNGQNDTYGLGLTKDLFGGGVDLAGFFAGYHAYPDDWIKDDSGQLAYGSIQPAAKSALAELAEMYGKGYIDPEFSVKDGSKVNESLVSGKIGMFYGPHPVPFSPLQDSKNKDPNADWRAYPLVSADSRPAVPMIGGSAGTFYVVNKNMKHPEAAIKLYNYFYDKDPAISPDFDYKYHGKNGENEKYPGQRFEWAVESSFYPKQNIFIHDNVAKYFNDNDQSVLDNYWVQDNVTQIQQYLDGDNKLWDTYAWSGPKQSAFSVISDYNKNDNFVVNGYIKADTDTMSKKGATLKQIEAQTFTKIIMGSAPIGDFDTFVQQWENLGGNEITQEVNAAK